MPGLAQDFIGKRPIDVHLSRGEAMKTSPVHLHCDRGRVQLETLLVPNPKDLFLPLNGIVKGFEPKQGVEAVAVFARQFVGPPAQKTVGGIAFDIYSPPFSTGLRGPLMSVVAGGAGDVSGSYRFSGIFMEKGKIAGSALGAFCQVDKFGVRMGGDLGHFVFGTAIFRVAGIAHFFQQVGTLVAKPSRPEVDPDLSVVRNVADTAGAGFEGCLVDCIF